MELQSIVDSNILFHIFLTTEIKNKEELLKLQSKENIVLLNPELILNLTHLSIALEKSVVQSKKKRLSRPIKRDVVYYTCESGKSEYCWQLHYNLILKEKEKTEKIENEKVEDSTCLTNNITNSSTNNTNLLNFYVIVISSCKEETKQNEFSLNSLTEETYDDKKLKQGLEKLLSCRVVEAENFSDYSNIKRIIKDFNLTEDESKTNSGILGAVYNRLSLKDLK